MYPKYYKENVNLHLSAMTLSKRPLLRNYRRKCERQVSRYNKSKNKPKEMVNQEWNLELQKENLYTRNITYVNNFSKSQQITGKSL